MVEPVGKVLVVDDNRINRLMLAKSVRKTGFEVEMAADGMSALAILKSKPIDVVLLDLVMPEMDGYEVLTRLKSDVVLQHIPVIIVSAGSEMERAIDCIKLGAVDFLSKPADPILLKARLDASLRAKLLYDAQLAYAETLAQQNEELDAYAHTVAHDLKAPIASLLLYVDLFLNVDDETLLANRDYLAQIAVISHRMRNIIDELLLLASVRKEDVQLVPIEMGAILKRAQSRLMHSIEAYNPVIILPDHWPLAMGHAPWIEEVWINYISNALKYGGTPPHLEFGWTMMPEAMVQFWLRDNGPGVTDKEMEKLFVPFTRLSQVQIEGQGLGLSIVRRIISKLNGQVGVESEAGSGSTFWFALPA